MLFKVEGSVARPYYYSNFIDLVTSKAASGLSYVIPVSSSGYDSVLYNAYFNLTEGEEPYVAMGPYAIDFIEAVKKLPETATRFDEKLINAAINAYNALEGKDDMKFVDESYVARFNKARAEYNVSVAENKIAHLFDMDNAKYFYDLVKDARATYLALTDEERALVSSGDVLDAKIAELSEAMGKTLDFSLEYEDYFPVSDEEPPVDEPPASEGGLEAWQIALIVGGGVLLAAAVAVAVILLLKKRSAKVSDSDAKED